MKDKVLLKFLTWNLTVIKMQIPIDSHLRWSHVDYITVTEVVLMYWCFIDAFTQFGVSVLPVCPNSGCLYAKLCSMLSKTLHNCVRHYINIVYFIRKIKAKEQLRYATLPFAAQSTVHVLCECLSVSCDTTSSPSVFIMSSFCFCFVSERPSISFTNAPCSTASNLYMQVLFLIV